MEQLEMLPQTNVDRDNERFKYREAIVLLPIVSLSLLRGISHIVPDKHLIVHESFSSTPEYFYLMHYFATLPGIMLVAFMTEIHGRKPVFMLLFFISLLSSILSHVPYQQPWAMIGSFLVATLNGGVVTINALSICEYCSPKHRFAWFTANYLVFFVCTRVFNRDFFTSSYLPSVEALIALAGLVSVYWWPESPYWLANQGRGEEGRTALLWLRKEGDAARKELRALETARRRTSPKLFWLSLLIAILAITVALCCGILTFRLMEIPYSYNDKIMSYMNVLEWCKICGNLIISLLLVLISYIVKRKVVYLGAVIIPLALAYIFSLWAYIAGENNYALCIAAIICEILLSGHLQFTVVFSVEAIPQKYYTYISCVCMVYRNIAFFVSSFFILPLFGESLIVLLVYGALALVAALLIYWLALETRGKNLLEIEKLYLARLFHENPENNETVPQNVSRLYNEITSTISQSRVSVIVGAAGCGKSTRAPLEVLRSCPDATVIVSGPRRVAAIGLARRVAGELEEKVGDTVGYQVRLDSKPPRPPAGSILYCTSGVLLRRLQANPGLHGCSHVFIDEAHERDVNTDITLLLLKRAVALNPDLRVAVMSATLDAHVFTRYFDSCPVVEVPGRTFPVETLYLDDIKQKYNLELSSTFDNCTKEDGKPQVNCQEVVDVVKAVDRTESEGAILVFLPGWAEIKQAKLLLDRCCDESTHLVLPVHSRLSTTDQARMFSKPLPGVRKIVLATNIAETSITIPDVVYVVDSGAHKESTLKQGTDTARLDTVWVSRAGAGQRAGRAGRVQPGHCFKLYTKEKESEFMPFSTPEILRVPLEQTVLDCKTYAPDDKVEDFLSQLPEPPPSKAIQFAVNDLIDLGALSRSEQLTRLGSLLSSFTLHPRLARGLVVGAVLGNSAAAAHVVTHCADNVEVFSNAAERKEEIREIKREFSATSDHVALHWIQQEFARARAGGEAALGAWCARYGLRRDRLAYVTSITNLYLGQLLKSPIVQPSVDVEELSRFSGIDELTPAALLCGPNSLLLANARLRTKGKLKPEVRLVTSKGDRAHIGGESVNHDAKKERGAIIAYFGGFHSLERRALVVYKTSRVSPQAVLVLCPGDICVGERYDDTTVLTLPRHKLEVHIPTSQVDHILKAREMLSKTVEYYIERDPNAISYEENTTVSRFKVRLVKAIGRILVEAHKQFKEKMYGNH